MGESAIKEAGTVYLPRASGMDDEDYAGYKTRAQYFNAAGRTHSGLQGMLNRKPVLYTIPSGMEKYLENVDGKGHSLQQFCQIVSKEKLTTNWGGILVDMPKVEDVRSQADFENQNLSAYMTFYSAEEIINWHWANDGRKQYLQYVIFKELTEKVGADYTTQETYNYRVCEINDKGYYQQSLYNDEGKLIDFIEPKGKKGVYKTIPFSFVSVDEMPKEPILEDLINVNLSHYRKSADYENGLHWTGVPTPWTQGAEVNTVVVNGKEVAESPLKLGGSVVQNLPSGASMHYLEFSGSGCAQIANAMRADEDRMAMLGSRIISQERNGVEAAETAKIHRAGENSVLTEIAVTLSIVIKKMLVIYLEWSSGMEVTEESVDVQFNTDYDVSTMNPQELTALVSLWQHGGIAKSDLFRNLKEGEILAADRDFDEMNVEIEEEQKARMATLPFNNNEEETEEEEEEREEV